MSDNINIKDAAAASVVVKTTDNAGVHTPHQNIDSGTLTTLTTLTGGGVAHDSVDSGNPHKVGFKAFSPDGTTPGTAVAENDRTDAKADLDGRLYINHEHPVAWSFHSDGSTALTDQAVKADPGDGFQTVITDIVFSADGTAAINLFFEEGSTKILGPFYLPATAGGMRVHFQTGKRVTPSTALTCTTSASHAHSVEVSGYVQAV